MFLTSTFSTFVTISLSKPAGVDKVNRWTRNAAQRREDYYYDALAFSGHSINLVFDEETMKPEKLTKAAENCRNGSSTMKLKKWYQGQNRESDDSQFPSSSRVSDPRAPTGTDRALHEVREPIEDDEEMLTMRQGDMPSLVPERVANPRIREDLATQKFQSNSDRMHRADSDDTPTHKHGFLAVEVSSHKL